MASHQVKKQSANQRLPLTNFLSLSMRHKGTCRPPAARITMCIRTQATAYAVSQRGIWWEGSVSTTSYYWKLHSPCCISGLELFNMIGSSDAHHACKQRQGRPLHEPGYWAEPHVGRLQFIGLPTLSNYPNTMAEQKDLSHVLWFRRTTSDQLHTDKLQSEHTRPSPILGCLICPRQNFLCKVNSANRKSSPHFCTTSLGLTGRGAS